ARLGAHASHQSHEVGSRQELDDAYAAAAASYPDEVPVPEEWGGFRVVPEAVEFWQGRPGRMHDRLVYRRAGESWSVHRLAP
ncbi:MAG: pyridoxine 5'-phosphate oxidase C-terminal domain-containing protein, partial [Nocardioides sp.]